MRSRTPFHRLADRRDEIGVFLVALVVAAACWYFGDDVWHSLLLGSAITTVALIGLVGIAHLDAVDTGWRSGEPTNRAGARRDVDQLAWSLRGNYGRVGSEATWRMRQLARVRLGRYQLDPFSPADRRDVQQLIGRRTYFVLVRSERRPPRLGSLLRCLDALDALDQEPRRAHER